MKTLSQTPSNTPWHHYRTQPPIDMDSRIQQRIDKLEREERGRLLNYEDERYVSPRDPQPAQKREWPWMLLVIGIVGYVIYALMTTPDWF